MSIHTSIALRCQLPKLNSRVTAIQVKMNLPLLQHCNAVTLPSLCSECGATTKRNAMNGPLFLFRDYFYP